MQPRLSRGTRIEPGLYSRAIYIRLRVAIVGTNHALPAARAVEKSARARADNPIRSNRARHWVVRFLLFFLLSRVIYDVWKRDDARLSLSFPYDLRNVGVSFKRKNRKQSRARDLSLEIGSGTSQWKYHSLHAVHLDRDSNRYVR